MIVRLVQPWAELLRARKIDAVSSERQPPEQACGARCTVFANGLDYWLLTEWARAHHDHFALVPYKRSAQQVLVYPPEPTGRWVDAGQNRTWKRNPKHGIGQVAYVELRAAGAVCSATLEGWAKVEQGKLVAQYRPGSSARFRRPSGAVGGPYVWVFRDVGPPARVSAGALELTP